MRDFRKLKVWDKSHQLVLSVYKATSKFPQREEYGLSSQLRRAATSIPTNISEGCGRRGKREFLHFLEIAFSSASEVEYLLFLSYELGYINSEVNKELTTQVMEVKRMLTGFIQNLKADT